MKNEETKNTRVRGKTFKIACSEEAALAIVNPFVNLTAYMLSITKRNELPSFKTMENSIASSKIRLAILLSNELCQEIDYTTLTSIGVETYAFGGYFKISCIETLPNSNGGFQRRPLKIILECETGLSLIEKISDIVENDYREKGIEKSSKALAEEVVKTFIKLGI